MYLLDSNVFLQAHLAHYPFDVFGSFWSAIENLAGQGIVASIDKVKDELVNYGDALSHWCQANCSPEFFMDSTTVIGNYGQVVGWATARQPTYTQAALNEFLRADKADSWLVAHGITDNSFVIVTHETAADPRARSRVKIPDACSNFAVRTINTIQMFREIGVKFT